MKNFLVVILLLLSHAAMAETYYVTFVKGTAKVAGAAKNIVIGDKLNDKDQLVFIDKSARISCISPAKGRFDITADKSKQNSKKEWVAVLTDLLVPSYSGKQLSTRAIAEETSVETLFKSSHPENKLLLVDDQWIDISTTAPLDKSNFYFLQYEVNGKTMVKKLPSKEHAISFNRSLLTGINGEVLSPEQVPTMALCSQSIQNGKPVSKVVVKFTPVFLSQTDFDTEVNLLRSNLKSLIQNTEKLNNEIYNHFYSNYGFVYPSLFRKWLK